MKGKIYYNKNMKNLFSINYNEDKYNPNVSNKITVHTPNQEDWDYVTKQMGYDWGRGFENEDRVIYLDEQEYDFTNDYKGINGFSKDYHLITIDQFKKII